MSYKSDKRITTIPQIFKLADQRKSIVHVLTGHVVPAAWMQNYPARVLFNMVKTKMLSAYKPKKK